MRAFFLFGEIRDRIHEDKAGITISRAWSLKTPGTVHLDIDLELDPDDLRMGGWDRSITRIWFGVV